MEATLEILIPASWSTFSSRWIVRVRSFPCAVRSRVRSRSRRISGGGTKLGRTNPCCTSWQIHSESLTSVLRPGTLRKWCALSNQHSNRSSSAWNTVFQYTPVASIPTSVTPASASHTASSESPGSVALNVCVCCSNRRRPWPGTRVVATTLSRCTSSPAHRSTITSTAQLPSDGN